MAKATPRIQGWDPLIIISQIVALQAIHYLTLCLATPILLSFFANGPALAYEGGSANVGMIMDWREMAGVPSSKSDHRGVNAFAGVWSGGMRLSTIIDHEPWNTQGWLGADARRRWIIAFCWLFAITPDVFFLYHIVRRPRLILDFSLTFLLNHLILTTYYAASVPSSWFFWFTMLIGTATMIVFTEHLCVRREMRDGLGAPPTVAFDDETGEGAPADESDPMEMGALLR